MHTWAHDVRFSTSSDQVHELPWGHRRIGNNREGTLSFFLTFLYTIKLFSLLIKCSISYTIERFKAFTIFSLVTTPSWQLKPKLVKQSFALKTIFCTMNGNHGLKNKAIISTLQWDHATDLRYVNLPVYLS